MVRVSVLFFFFLMSPRPPRSTLFPYTTLFRAADCVCVSVCFGRVCVWACDSPVKSDWPVRRAPPPLCPSPGCPGPCIPYRPPGRTAASPAAGCGPGNDYSPPRSDLNDTHTVFGYWSTNSAHYQWLKCTKAVVCDSHQSIPTTHTLRRTYLQTHWSGSQCRRLGNCTLHTRSLWTLHCLERQEGLFRNGWKAGT